jgi:hypothetical protein
VPFPEQADVHPVTVTDGIGVGENVGVTSELWLNCVKKNHTATPMTAIKINPTTQPPAEDRRCPRAFLGE